MLSVENVNFKYQRQKNLCLHNISFEVAQGSILGIVGSSGCGKSTLLRIVSGLENNASGRIVINQKVVQDDNAFVPPHKRGVGMLFQDYALFPHMTVRENIAFGVNSQQQERVRAMLDLIQMNGYENKYPHELSGGQKQRVALGRALAPAPQILLLDEPFSNLDKDLQGSIREELAAILKQANITTILVTHNEDDIRAMANYQLALSHGEITQYSKIE